MDRHSNNLLQGSSSYVAPVPPTATFMAKIEPSTIVSKTANGDVYKEQSNIGGLVTFGINSNRYTDDNAGYVEFDASLTYQQNAYKFSELNNDTGYKKYGAGNVFHRDSTGAIYVAGSSALHLTVKKYTGSGTLTLAYSTNIYISDATFGANMAGGDVDSSGNVYVSASCFDVNGAMFVTIFKLTPTGAISWQKRLTVTGTTVQHSNQGSTNLKIDGSGNIYLYFNDGYQNNWMAFYLLKLTNAGAVSWQRKIALPSSNPFIPDTQFQVDSSGNAYVNVSEFSAFGPIAIKISSTGTISWQKKVTGLNAGGIADSPASSGAICVDNASNVYVLTYRNNANTGTCGASIALLSSAGALSWVHHLPITASNYFNAGTLTTDSTNLLIGYDAQISSVVSRMLASVPCNGSKLGTYTNFSYTDITASFTVTDYTAVISTTTIFSLTTPTYSAVADGPTTVQFSLTPISGTPTFTFIEHI